MLEVRDVVKSYDGRAVVNRVSFEVRPGEIFALLGPNGAGKTTLIRMITDILKPDSGTITLDGRPIGGGLKHEISYLPEERGLYRRVPVIDALSYYGRLRDMSAREARAQAAELLERVGLKDWMLKQVQALSKGMQQKVQLCTRAHRQAAAHDLGRAVQAGSIR
jgi:ABC-2 type transport system ATP-binding protein